MSYSKWNKVIYLIDIWLIYICLILKYHSIQRTLLSTISHLHCIVSNKWDILLEFCKVCYTCITKDVSRISGTKNWKQKIHTSWTCLRISVSNIELSTLDCFYDIIKCLILTVLINKKSSSISYKAFLLDSNTSTICIYIFTPKIIWWCEHLRCMLIGNDIISSKSWRNRTNLNSNSLSIWSSLSCCIEILSDIDKPWLIRLSGFFWRCHNFKYNISTCIYWKWILCYLRKLIIKTTVIQRNRCLYRFCLSHLNMLKHLINRLTFWISFD